MMRQSGKTLHLIVGFTQFIRIRFILWLSLVRWTISSQRPTVCFLDEKTHRLYSVCISDRWLIKPSPCHHRHTAHANGENRQFLIIQQQSPLRFCLVHFSRHFARVQRSGPTHNAQPQLLCSLIKPLYVRATHSACFASPCWRYALPSACSQIVLLAISEPYLITQISRAQHNSGSAGGLAFVPSLWCRGDSFCCQSRATAERTRRTAESSP